MRPYIIRISRAGGEGELVATEEPIDASNLPNDEFSQCSPFGLQSKEIEFSRNSITCLNECYTNEARRLCIFDVVQKLRSSDHYDIGGTYDKPNSNKPELWFYCTTSICPQSSYLLNIFFCYRGGGTVSIGISDTKTILKKRTLFGDTVSSHRTLPESLCWKMFKSNEPDESHHLISYSFSEGDAKMLIKQTLSIPIEIIITKTSIVDRGAMLRIKKNHNLSGLFKPQENTDYTLESTSGKKYEVHKLLLATHSTVLRNTLKNSNSDSLSVAIDDIGMEQFIEYIYTGTVKNILEHNWSQLIELADKFKLEILFKEAENAIAQQICVNNAIDIAVLSEKYKLARIQKAVFDFIKCNPNVMETEGWKNLKDIELTKKLFKEVYNAQN